MPVKITHRALAAPRCEDLSSFVGVPRPLRRLESLARECFYQHNVTRSMPFYRDGLTPTRACICGECSLVACFGRYFAVHVAHKQDLVRRCSQCSQRSRLLCRRRTSPGCRPHSPCFVACTGGYSSHLQRQSRSCAFGGLRLHGWGCADGVGDPLANHPISTRCPICRYREALRRSWCACARR